MPTRQTSTNLKTKDNIVSRKFTVDEQRIIHYRSVGDRFLWDTLRLIVQRMMEWGFKKRQILDYVSGVKKDENE